MLSQINPDTEYQATVKALPEIQTSGDHYITVWQCYI